MPATAEQAQTVRHGRNYNFWLDPDLAEAIEAYRQSQEIKVGYAAFFDGAVKSFLKGKGFWPPPKPPGQPEHP